VKRDHSDKKNERISRVSYHLVLCHWLKAANLNMKLCSRRLFFH